MRKRRISPRIIAELRMRIRDARVSVGRAASRLARMLRQGAGNADSLFFEVRNAYRGLMPFKRGRPARARELLLGALQRLGTLTGRGIGQMPFPAPIMPGGGSMGPMTAAGPVRVPGRPAPYSRQGRLLVELRHVHQLLMAARRMLR